MDRLADSDEISARTAVVRGVEVPVRPRSIRTDIPEALPILPGESDLILQHIGDVLADLFDP